MRVYCAALALGLGLLLGEAVVVDAGGRGGGRGGGHGFHGGKGGGSHGKFHGFRGGSGHHGGHHQGFRHHGSHHHGFRSKVFIGAAPFFLWGPSYWGPGYFYTPPPVAAAPVYVQPDGYWYYCPSARAYYPYVTNCLEAWVPVPAR